MKSQVVGTFKKEMVFVLLDVHRCQNYGTDSTERDMDLEI